MRPPVAGGCALTLATALAACATGAPDYLEYAANQDRQTVANRIAERIGVCWFAGNSKGFGEFAYAPELNSAVGRPRILIVEKKDPTGLPKLVVEISENKHTTVVKLFGPLLATSSGRDIQRDVERWADGGAEC